MAQSQEEASSPSRESRRGILTTVTTPLIFFALALLIVDSAIGILAATSSGQGRTLLVGVMALVIVVVVGIVAWLEHRHPGVVTGKRPEIFYSVVISAPENMPGLDLSQISWADEKCFFALKKKRVPVSLAPGAYGVSFEIRIPPELFQEIAPTDVVRFVLMDSHDLRWGVEPFFIHQRPARLVPHSKKEDIFAVYGGKNQ